MPVHNSPAPHAFTTLLALTFSVSLIAIGQNASAFAIRSGIHFFASPFAVFSSGQSFEETLQQGLLRSENRLSFEVTWKNRTWQIENGGLVTAQDLEADNIGQTLVDSYLRNGPSHKDRVLTTVPLGSKVRIEKISGPWVYVVFFESRGWLDINHLATRFDFANWVWIGDEWERVQFRQNEFLKTENALVPIELSTKIYLDPERAIITKPVEKGPPIRAFAAIARRLEARWNFSHLKDHGFVWWRDPHRKFETPSVPLLKTEDLLRSPIYSYAVESTALGPLALASSKGVYLSTDQVGWSKVPVFGDCDYPVAISPKGLLYVGPYLSRNLGRSFEPFLDPKELAQKVELLLNRPPLSVKIKDLIPLPSGRLKIKVEANARILQLEI